MAKLKLLCSPAASKAGMWRLVFTLNSYIPFTKLKRFLVACAPNAAIRELKYIVDTMDQRSHEIYYDKRRALLAGDEALKQQVGEGKDIMSVLRESPLLERCEGSLNFVQSGPTWKRQRKIVCPKRRSSHRCRKPPFISASSPADDSRKSRTLTFAGTDTTSNALAKILEILADRQDVQEKLRAEIMEARNGQDIGYDQLTELPYLDAICRETIRL